MNPRYLTSTSSRASRLIVIIGCVLLIEVAEMSLSYNRSTKLRLYAEMGIPEYWVANGPAASLEVYRLPDAGGYRDVRPGLRRRDGDPSGLPRRRPDARGDLRVAADPPAHYFGVPAVAARSATERARALTKALAADHPTVIEAKVDPSHYLDTVYD